MLEFNHLILNSFSRLSVLSIKKIIPEIVYYDHWRQKMTVTSITLGLAAIRNHRRQRSFCWAPREQDEGEMLEGHSADRNEALPSKRFEQQHNCNPGDRGYLYLI